MKGEPFWTIAVTPASVSPPACTSRRGRAQQVAPGEGADGDPGEEVGPETGLHARVGVDALDYARVQAEAGGEGEAAPVDDPKVDFARAPVVGHREQMLGGVDDVAGDAEHLAEHVGRAARQAAERGGGAEQAVGGFVDGAVAAEGDDDVIALVRGLATQLGGVTAGLGVDGVDFEAALQGIDDEVTQAVGDRGGVGIDDDQHAPLARGQGGLEVLGGVAGLVWGVADPGRYAHRLGVHRARGGVTVLFAFAEMLAKLRGEHSWTHPEGWRDWPYETPATTVTSQREGANSREMCGGPSCSSPHR